MSVLLGLRDQFIEEKIRPIVTKVGKDLIDKAQSQGKEVIIATSATVEGQTTAHYIEDTIKNGKIKITKLAQGLPVGGEIEQLDDGTLFSAFKNRVPVTDN